MSEEDKIKIYFKKLDHAKNLPLPAYESDEAAGMDIRAALDKPKTLEPGERDLIPTGLQMALPVGYEAQIRPRSGLAYKHGITMLNTPGTIDSDYRGEVKVLAINHGDQPYKIEHGDRIAQMVIAPVYQPQIEETESLPETNRGKGGFGSTGVK
ncbi:dUTP diphosphatase [Rhodohalobacter sp.]|uniref:dUTP diphosphatase n=1 Tax=Rhodohalobacter sp. TaxID=1974210 RepID=UPI002ACE4A34|nr:dUTP diphosphatase [Rhodohalobacter sp.]MDZ7756916.1 dUTP diphosphatase [Rhodohalobacter sp.]